MSICRISKVTAWFFFIRIVEMIWNVCKSFWPLVEFGWKLSREFGLNNFSRHVFVQEKMGGELVPGFSDAEGGRADPVVAVLELGKEGAVDVTGSGVTGDESAEPGEAENAGNDERCVADRDERNFQLFEQNGGVDFLN